MSARRASVIDALRVATIPLQARPPTCDRESANDGRIGRATSADPKLDHGHPHQSPSNLRRILGPAAYRPVRRSIEPPPIDPGLRCLPSPGHVSGSADVRRSLPRPSALRSCSLPGRGRSPHRRHETRLCGFGLALQAMPSIDTRHARRSLPPCGLAVQGASVGLHARPACENLKGAAQRRDVLREVAVHDEDVGGVPLHETTGLARRARTPRQPMMWRSRAPRPRDSRRRPSRRRRARRCRALRRRHAGIHARRSRRPRAREAG